jgi:hypothetical protein
VIHFSSLYKYQMYLKAVWKYAHLEILSCSSSTVNDHFPVLYSAGAGGYETISLSPSCRRAGTSGILEPGLGSPTGLLQSFRARRTLVKDMSQGRVGVEGKSEVPCAWSWWSVRTGYVRESCLEGNGATLQPCLGEPEKTPGKVCRATSQQQSSDAAFHGGRSRLWELKVQCLNNDETYREKRKFYMALKSELHPRAVKSDLRGGTQTSV